MSLWGIAMARKRAAQFDPPTDAEALEQPDAVLRGPRGGWMWKCHFCGRPAVHIGQEGRKVCKAHGGTTAAQRDPVKVQEAAERGEVLRPPGRPVVHGLYARLPGVRVDELIQQYLDSGVDADDTNEDMLALRAQLSELRPLLPEMLEIHLAAKQLAERLQNALTTELLDEGNLTLEKFLIAIEQYEPALEALHAFRDMSKDALRIIKSIEDRHAKLILLSKVRAETRLKNAAAEQLTVFKVMVERLDVINKETLPSNQYEALTLRYARELSEVPQSALKGVRA